MSEIIYLLVLFAAKMLDNFLSTMKNILVQHNRGFLAGIVLGFSNFIYFVIIQNIATDDNVNSLIVLSIASGVGAWIAVAFNNHFSKDKTYVNVIMSDDIDAMKSLRSFLAENKITNVAGDSYTLDWNKKTLSITAYAETKDQSKLIDDYLDNSGTKFKRMVQGDRVK